MEGFNREQAMDFNAGYYYDLFIEILQLSQFRTVEEESILRQLAIEAAKESVGL